jgi:hypothetical protein
VDAEINNVIYMELYLGAKMADGKYRKTYVAGSIDRENTVPYNIVRRYNWGFLWEYLFEIGGQKIKTELRKYY